MTSITWAGSRCVQEPAAILAPENRTQGRCGSHVFLRLFSPIHSYTNSNFGDVEVGSEF